MDSYLSSKDDMLLLRVCYWTSSLSSSSGYTYAAAVEPNPITAPIVPMICGALSITVGMNFAKPFIVLDNQKKEI
jgi:hypothetical protein